MMVCFCRSIGATVVEMLTKNPPWHELEPMAALFKIANEKKARYKLGDHVSSQAREFIEKAFLEASDRPSANDLLSHSFIIQGYG